MAHAQKPDFVFRRNGRVHLNRQGASVQSTIGRRAVYISLQDLYCSCKPVFCSHVTLTGYPLHSLVSPSLLLRCVTVCHHISNAVYLDGLLVLCQYFTVRFRIEYKQHLQTFAWKLPLFFSHSLHRLLATPITFPWTRSLLLLTYSVKPERRSQMVEAFWISFDISFAWFSQIMYRRTKRNSVILFWD
jgi:hypothetical protein